MLRLAAALVGLALIASCVGTSVEDGGAPAARSRADADLCRQVDDLLLSGQRNSFSLKFAEAENAFVGLLALYGAHDVAGQCPDRPSRAFTLMNQALAHSSQERFATAFGLFARADALLSDGTGIAPGRLERERALLKAYRAQDLLNRSAVIGARELTEAAADAFPESLDVASLAVSLEDAIVGGSDESRRSVIDSAANSYARAHILLLEGDLDGSMDSINEALDLVNLVPRSAALYRPRFLAQRALIAYERRDYEAARRDAESAADSFAALLARSPLEARARITHGRALAALGRIEESLAEYERGFRIYEETPVIVEFRTIWPYFQLSLAQAARNPDARRDHAARMFRAAQVIRRSITAQTVSGAAALLAQGDTEKADAVRAWRAAEERFATIKALQIIQLQDPLNQSEQSERLAREVAAAGGEVERLRAARDRISPEYGAAIAAPVSLEELQAALRPDEALIQIATGEPRSMIFVVTRTEVSAHALRATESQIATIVAAVRQAVKVDGKGYVPAFKADLAHTLHDLIFRDSAAAIAGYGKLVIAASGALQSLPFELLVTAPPDSAPDAGWLRRGDYSAIRWLGAEKALSYVPSPRNLVDIRRGVGASRGRRAIAAFGDFTPGVEPEKILRAADLPANCIGLARAIDDIGALPGTAAEVAAVAGLFGASAEARTGAAFTEAAIKAASAAGTLADFRVAHFATHGVLWPSPDCFTEPALTVSATDAEDSDGLLTASEIRALRLDAQLVVLSACNTASTYLASLGGDAAARARAARGAGGGAGGGPPSASLILRESGGGGESLSGLARAFFSAGARTVLATHWPVADAETTGLMVDFYTALRDDGATLTDALQRAQAALRAAPETSHPFFWAPFVLIGDGDLTLGDAAI